MAAIFCYEDQLHAQVENAVSASPDMAFVAHGPTVSWAGETLPSLQIRASSQWCAAAADALLRRVMPLCLQRGAGSAGGAVGIDLGVVRFATLSDGTFYAPLNSFRRHATALRKTQQAMCRKQKFSNNWKKAKGRIQRLHARIGNARRDYLHKTSTAISQNHAMVCIEDLQVRNMSKSAAGSIQAPGKHVRAKSGLNKSILDQGWFEFRRQLEYKLEWNGGELIVVPPQNTSRTCPECDHISAENRQPQARFVCIQCGFEENADRVGAINILRAGQPKRSVGNPAKRHRRDVGHARCACQVSDASDRQQQEPAEAIQELLNAAWRAP